MNAEEALNHCQAYLDRQLDPATTAAIDEVLARDPEVAAAYAQEREFHDFLKARAAKVEAPASLAGGIKARLRQESAQRPSNITLLRPKQKPQRSWLLIAAGVAIAVMLIGIVAKSLTSKPDNSDHSIASTTTTAPTKVEPKVAVTQSPVQPPKDPQKPTRECPYMVACATEHSSVADGKNPVKLQSEDRTKLASFVSTNVKAALQSIPALQSYQLKPSGAGIATFGSLKRYGAPDAAFVSYNGPANEAVTLFVHPWPKEEPMAMNLQKFEGHNYWVAIHGAHSVAAWKSDDGKLLLSLVSSRSKDETFKIARDARSEFNSQHALLELLERNSAMRVANALP